MPFFKICHLMTPKKQYVLKELSLVTYGLLSSSCVKRYLTNPLLLLVIHSNRFGLNVSRFFSKNPVASYCICAVTIGNTHIKCRIEYVKVKIMELSNVHQKCHKHRNNIMETNCLHEFQNLWKYARHHSETILDLVILFLMILSHFFNFKCIILITFLENTNRWGNTTINATVPLK